MNTKWILFGTLLISCGVSACSDSNNEADQQGLEIKELQARLDANDTTIRDRDRELKKLENENQQLGEQSSRLSQEQMNELRKRIANLEAIEDETIELSGDLEEFHSFFDDEKAKFTERMQEVTADLEEAREMAQGDAGWGLDRIPELIQNLKDELTETVKENGKLKAELTKLRASQR